MPRPQRGDFDQTDRTYGLSKASDAARLNASNGSARRRIILVLIILTAPWNYRELHLLRWIFPK
jgi:hypothetical protein